MILLARGNRVYRWDEILLKVHHLYCSHFISSFAERSSRAHHYARQISRQSKGFVSWKHFDSLRKQTALKYTKGPGFEKLKRCGTVSCAQAEQANGPCMSSAVLLQQNASFHPRCSSLCQHLLYTSFSFLATIVFQHSDHWSGHFCNHEHRNDAFEEGLQ